MEIQTGTTNFMVRFNIDGTIDSSFGNNGYVTNCFQSVIYYSSRLGYDSITGNIYIVGNTVVSGSPFNTYFSTIECYTSTGILNTTFNGSGFRTWTLATYQQKINNLKIDSVGKIILVGLKGYSSYHGNDSATDSWMLRLNTDGTMDNTFSDDGMFSLRTGTFYSENYDYSSSVYLKDDNSILVVGSAGTYIANHQFMVYEVTNSGVLASTSMPISFPHPATWENKGLELVKDSNGKYILGGSVQVGAIDPNFAILRIGVDYTVDNTFGISGWISAYNQNYNYVLNRLAVQADNKILVLGITKTVPSPTETPSIVIARYLDSSILDNEDIAKNNPIVVSPNPASSILNVSVNDIGFLNTAYQIVDVNGRIINNGILTTNISEINVGELSKGIYFIKFENQNLVQKFIKK